jgi:hypothetical protein
MTVAVNDQCQERLGTCALGLRGQCGWHQDATMCLCPRRWRRSTCTGNMYNRSCFTSCRGKRIPGTRTVLGRIRCSPRFQHTPGSPLLWCIRRPRWGVRTYLVLQLGTPHQRGAQAASHCTRIKDVTIVSDSPSFGLLRRP